MYDKYTARPAVFYFLYLHRFLAVLQCVRNYIRGPQKILVLLGKRSKRAKDKQMNEKSLVGQKRDLRRVH